MPDRNQKAAKVRAVDRAIDILQAFTADRPELTLAELGRQVSLNRPTLYRMLATLQERGLVCLAGDQPRYRLDYGAAKFAEVWSSSLDLGPMATPFLEELLERYDETVALYLRHGNTRFCAVELPSHQPLSFSRGVGHAESLLRGASGLAIISFLASAEIDVTLGEEKDAPSRRTLRQNIEQVRERGYALSSGDLIVGAQAIAAPVFNHTGRAIASVGLFGPTARFTEERINECAEAVQKTASSLSRGLGYTASSIPQRVLKAQKTKRAPR